MRANTKNVNHFVLPVRESRFASNLGGVCCLFRVILLVIYLVDVGSICCGNKGAKSNNVSN